MSGNETGLTNQSAVVNIAYQVMGDEPIDIILVAGLSSRIEFLHEMPDHTAFLCRLSIFTRVMTLQD